MAGILNNKKRLQDTLNEITAAGIRADKQQLKKDMRAQFSNYREWIREYVVNAYDALAGYCRISGEKQDDEITVTVQDDGMGMNRERIHKFFTLYASEKDLEAGRAIGTHGIGKLSIAAIPDQLRFEMETSDGTGAWLAQAGKLDGTGDIRVRPVLSDIPRGTTFRITYKSTLSLMKEMTLLKEVLVRYTRFLPFHITIALPLNGDESKQIPYSINENWDTYSDSFSRKYNLQIKGNSYEVHMDLGDSVHEIYQNRVLVSSSYNLLSHGLKNEWNLGYLTIRVNSSSFELPFGRHCLSDEEILHPLSAKIRNELLTQYMADLYHYVEHINVHESRNYALQADVLTCNLIGCDPSLNKPWCQYEFIRTRKLGKLSFRELTELVRKYGRFFVEDESNAGIDYSNFSEPVLDHDQAGDLINLLKALFKDYCIFLKSTDLVFEKTGSDHLELNDLQKTFEKNLGFHPDLITRDDLRDLTDEEMDAPLPGEEYLNFGQGLFNEVDEACKDLSTLKWKASFLVEKDFKTPCLTHLFIYTNHTIILNLHHPLIEKLVALSEVNPRLAGHWGVSLCLEDGRNVFPYLSADTRKELLMLDGIAKLLEGRSRSHSGPDKEAYNRMFSEFKRNLNDAIRKNMN